MTKRAKRQSRVRRKTRAGGRGGSLPRLLLLWWSCWLLASWILAYSRYWSIMPSEESFRAAAQMMMVSVSLGLCLVWPLYRLSMRLPKASRWLPMLDWLAMAGTLQVVLWPMRLSAHWTPIRVTLMDSMLCAWGLLFGALISLGLRDWSAWGRAKWMLLCMMLILAGPLAEVAMVRILGLGGAMFDASGVSEFLYWSPITGTWVMAGQDAYGVTGAQWARVGLLVAAAILAWGAVVLWPGDDEIQPRQQADSSTPATGGAPSS